MILKEPFEEAALLIAGALAGCFPEFEDMVEADPVRQEFDPSLESTLETCRRLSVHAIVYCDCVVHPS